MNIGPAAGLEAAAAAISSLMEPEPEDAHGSSNRSADSADAAHDLTLPSSAPPPESAGKSAAWRDAGHLDVEA